MLKPARIEVSNKLSLLCLTLLLLATLFTGRAMALTTLTCDDSKGKPLVANDAASGMTTDLEVTGPCEVKGSASHPLSQVLLSQRQYLYRAECRQRRQFEFR